MNFTKSYALYFSFLIVFLISCSEEKLVTIEAHYMQYACGDGNIDMNVISVDNKKYNTTLRKDISPETTLFTQEKLIQFVTDKTYRWQTHEEGSLKDFTLIGRFESRSSTSDCQTALTFYVKRIKYGNETNYQEF